MTSATSTGHGVARGADAQRTGVLPDTSPGGPAGTADAVGPTGPGSVGRRDLLLAERVGTFISLSPGLAVRRAQSATACRIAHRSAVPPRPASRPGNGTHHRGSYAARLAIARSAARKPASRGPSALLAVALVGVVSVLGIVSAGAIATGGAAAVTIATLDQGLPDVQAFRDLDFSEPTRIVDRTGKVELAQFWNERRTVIDFEDVPPLVLDVTTATEDDTFWDNPGFDLEATVNAFLDGGGGWRRPWWRLDHHAAARACPAAAGGDRSARTTRRRASTCARPRNCCSPTGSTQAFPGEEGKKAIIAAYLNEISYGAAQGIAAAAEIYLGKDLDELTRERGRPAGGHPAVASRALPLGDGQPGPLRERGEGVVRQEARARASATRASCCAPATQTTRSARTRSWCSAATRSSVACGMARAAGRRYRTRSTRKP